MKRTIPTEKRISSHWYIIAQRWWTPRSGHRDVQYVDRDYPTRRAAERAAQLLRKRGFCVFLRHWEEVQVYEGGRKVKRASYVTSYTHGKERFF